jgi:hypothetical protein
MCEGHFAKLLSCLVLVRFYAEIRTDMLENSFASLKLAIDRSEIIFFCAPTRSFVFSYSLQLGSARQVLQMLLEGAVVQCIIVTFGTHDFEALTREPAMMLSYSSSSFEQSSLLPNAPVCKYFVLLAAPAQRRGLVPLIENARRSVP